MSPRFYLMSTQSITSPQCYTIIHVSPVSWYSVVILYYTSVPKVLPHVYTKYCFSPVLHHHTCVQSVLILSSETISVFPRSYLMSTQSIASPQCYTIIHVSPVSRYSVVILYYTSVPKVLPHVYTKYCFSPVLHHHTCVPSVLILSSETIPVFPRSYLMSTQSIASPQCNIIIHVSPRSWYSAVILYYTSVPKVLPHVCRKYCFSPVLYHHTCVPKVLILSSDLILYQCPQGLTSSPHKALLLPSVTPSYMCPQCLDTQ